jgi:hypothetical protein
MIADFANDIRAPFITLCYNSTAETFVPTAAAHSYIAQPEKLVGFQTRCPDHLRELDAILAKRPFVAGPVASRPLRASLNHAMRRSPTRTLSCSTSWTSSCTCGRR